MSTHDSDLEARALALFEQALEQPRRVREDFIMSQSADNPKLQTKALALLAQDGTSGSVFLTGQALSETIDDAVMPERIGVYKIESLIGRGGMGAVYQGLRDAGDFEHKVAIKVIRAGVMSPKLVARFETERQTLANLSHPHIARLYDGGTAADGAPYFVMEYIDGEPIDRWVAVHKLSQRERIDIFILVCSAVRHAHQNLIVHRDITPSNVLVARGGLPKLIDFGISKIHDDTDIGGAAPSSIDSLSFTPGFAAPERMRGDAANTLSDIFSLGKLFEVIAGAPDADMRAIIDKAIAHAPADRYASVDAFVDDINNYLGGFAISAAPASRLTRFIKFTKRNTLSVGLSALAACLIAGAFAITAMQYRRAEQALAGAESRFAETRELTGFLLNDLGEDLGKLPGTLNLQRKVSDTSARYLDVLAKAAKTNPDVTLDYVKGKIQLGDILTQSGGRNLGDHEAGIKHFEDVIATLEGLIASGQDTPEIQRLLAQTRMVRAFAYRFYYNDISKLEDAAAFAVPVFNAQLADDPDNIELKAALLDIRFELWMMRNSAKDKAEIDDDLLAIRRDIETVFEGNLENDDQIINYGSFLYITAAEIAARWKHGYVKLPSTIPSADRKMFETALDFAKTGFEYVRRDLERDPANPEHIYTYFWSLEVVAPYIAFNRAWRPNLATLEQSLNLPAGKAYKQAVANIVNTDPRFKPGLEDAQLILGYLETSEALLERLKPFDDGTYSYFQIQYTTLRNYASVYANLYFDLDKAETYLSRAAAIPQGFLNYSPGNKRVILELANVKLLQAHIISRSDAVYGRNRTQEICAFTDQADHLLTGLPGSEIEAAPIRALQTFSSELRAAASCP